MATHSSILAWRIPGTEEPGGLRSMGVAQSRTRLWRLSNSSSCSALTAQALEPYSLVRIQASPLSWVTLTLSRLPHSHPTQASHHLAKPGQVRANLCRRETSFFRAAPDSNTGARARFGGWAWPRSDARKSYVPRVGPRLRRPPRHGGRLSLLVGRPGGTSGCGRRRVSPLEERRQGERCRWPSGTEPSLEARAPPRT